MIKKMEKITLHGLGNSETFNYYIFDKKKEVYFALAKIIQNVFNDYLEIYNEENKKINIERYKDVHGGLVIMGGPEIDIFYGDKRFFLILHCSKKLRLKFNEELFKISHMPKLEPIKKIKKTKNKK